MRHQARARFGQNFLTDASVIHQIIEAINPSRTDNMVEIGPGLSALTEPLIARLGHLTVIELDRDLAARLRNKYAPEVLTVVQGDALDVDLRAFGQQIRLVGNLPYNISTPLLFACMNAADQIFDQHFMLQREVVERMVAKVGDSDYSRLSVMLQYRYQMQKLFDVSPTAFEPAPKVVSAVVRMRPLASTRVRAKDEALLSQVVKRAFAQRRKMLRGALGAWAALVPWQAIGIEPTDRAQQVDVAGFIRISDALSEARVVPATTDE